MNRDISLENYGQNGRITLLALLGVVMAVISAGVLTVMTRQTLGDEACSGATACGIDCPVWCKPEDSPQNCNDNCPSCENQNICPSICQELVAPCCGPDDNCETFPPVCCDNIAHVNCTDPLVALTYLNDNANYKGKPTGLYTNRLVSPVVRTNTIPDCHLAAARINGGGIVPRNSLGQVEWDENATDPGYIGVMSIGFSNLVYEFNAFIDNYVVPGAEMNSRLVIVNGAEGGKAVCDWRLAKGEERVRC